MVIVKKTGPGLSQAKIATKYGASKVCATQNMGLYEHRSRFLNYTLKNMTLQHLQSYYAEKLKTLSVNSLRKQHCVISGALLDAARDKIIPVNFADYVEFPKAEKFQGKAYSAEQVASLLNAAKVEGEPIRAAIVLAVCYGLRRSEVCGLRWQDIDFEAGKLCVCNTVTINGELRLEGERTKTAKSHRIIDLISSTVPYLQGLKYEQTQRGIPLDKVGSAEKAEKSAKAKKYRAI